jgi:hypothetical protein
MGAQLSEVLTAEATSSEEGGFSRRRVVKGVAWSVPVIVAAVGAPPASASPGPITPPTVNATLDLVGGGTKLFKVGSSSGVGNQRSGSCPSSIRITSTGAGLVTGVAAGRITITPNVGAPAGVGIDAIQLAPFTPASFTPASGFKPDNSFVADFAYPNAAGIATGAPMDLALRFNYQATNSKVTATYDVELILTLPSLAKSLTARGSVTVDFNS